MSQAKVDRYKEQKSKRKETIQKEKQQAGIRKGVVAVICAACLCWIGYSVWGVVNRPDTTASEVNLDAYSEYLNGLAEEE